MQRKIIRNGEMQFEVDNFDSAYTQISRIVTEEQGFIATTNSQKLPNGKTQGIITVRSCPIVWRRSCSNSARWAI